MIFVDLQPILKLQQQWHFCSAEKFMTLTFPAFTGIFSIYLYRQTSNIITLIGNGIVDHLDVFGASPVGATSLSSI